MNKDKVIKDLKERNDKLKNQYQLQEIRLFHLEYVNQKQKEVLDKIKEYLNKVELGELENGKPYTFKDFLKEEIEIENEEAKWLLELLEEVNE